MGSFLWMVLFSWSICEEGAVWGLSLTTVRIEGHAMLGNDSTLECHFDLQGENLYSVKWYKDGQEFYRYLPRDKNPVQLFPMKGVDVDVDSSNSTQVRLRGLSLTSTGRYRCEVSAEAPSFQTVSDHGDMLVVALPSEGPKIRGGRPRYQLGESVRVNCTSGRSKPPTQLMWFINGDPDKYFNNSPVSMESLKHTALKAERSFLRGPRIAPAGDDGLEVTTLGLEFKVEARHFHKGDLKLKCLATIATIYWNSNEESVEGERPQRTPAMEVRETNRSRADRVHSQRQVPTMTAEGCQPLSSFILLILAVLFSLCATTTFKR